MNLMIFRLLSIDFDMTDYQLVDHLLSEVTTFKSQLYLWSQKPGTDTIPPPGYDAYLINDLARKDAEIVSWRAANWIGKLSPAPAIVLVETPADGMAALAAGAADYLLRQDLTAPVLERSLRLTITYFNQDCRHLEPEPTDRPADPNRIDDLPEIRSPQPELSQNKLSGTQPSQWIEQIANYLPQLIYIYDLKNDRNIYINQQVTQILGYTPEEMQQGGLKFLLNLVHADDWFVFKQLFAEKFLTLTDGEAIETEYRVKHQNGSWRWLSCRDVVFTRDADGLPVQILGTAIDITNHKLIAQQLSETEAQLYSVFTNTTEGILIVDPKGVVRFANPAAAKLFNQNLEDLLQSELKWPMVVGESAELEIVQSSGQLRIGEMLVAQTELTGESVYVVSLRDITEQRQVEQALQEIEQRFRQLTQYVEDAFWLFTLVPLKILYVSPAYERIWGRTCDSLYEDPLKLFQHIHPDDRDLFRRNLHQQGQGEFTTLEYRIVRPDGEIRWICDRAFPVTNKRGKVVRVTTISEDITKRKENINKLQIAYTQLDFHLQNSPLGFIEWTQDFRVSQWSGSAENIFGWSAEQAIGKRYDDWGFIYEDSWEIFEEVIDRMVNKKQARMIFQATNSTKDKQPIYCQWYNSILLDERGRLLSLFSLVLDVSDRHQAELALRESEEKFRAIFDRAAVGMSICTLEGKFFRVNQKLCDIVGYSRPELLERTFQDLTVVKDRRENQDNVRQLLAGNLSNYSMEKRYISKTGSIVWVNVMVSLMRDVHNQPTYFIYVVEDISDRKRAEIALTNSEERFRVIFEQAAVGIFRRNTAGEFIQVNQKFCDLLGYNESELLGQKFHNFIQPEDLLEHLVCLEQILADRIKTFHLEQRYIRKNGQQQWVKVVISVVYEAEAKPQYLIGIVEDIHERKITELKLQYRLALETAVAQASRQLAIGDRPDLNRVLKTIGQAAGADRVFLNCFSDNCTKISMIAEWCEPTTNHYTEKFQQIETDRFSWWTQQLHHNQNIIVPNIDRLPTSATAEKNYLQSIGVRSVLAVPIFNGSNSARPTNTDIDCTSGCNLWGTIGLNSYAMDKNWSNEDAQMLRIVGEMIYNYFYRTETEAELRDSEALYAGIFDHTAESIFLLQIRQDEKLIYETINPTNERLFAITREQVVGKSLSEVRSLQFTSNFRQHLRQCIDRKQPINYEETITLSQETRHLLTTLVPITDSTGKIIKIQGSSRDITTQKQVEAALQTAKQAADRANRAKSIFLANMSHELRTPLNAILGFTQLLNRDPNITTEQRKQLEIILRSGEHLLSLINDVLDLSKIEAGRIVLQIESFNLFQMLDTLYDMLQIRAMAKGLKLQIIRTADVPKYIKTDQNKLRQILINLVGNAIKFTNSGSVSVHISTVSHTSKDEDLPHDSTPNPQTSDCLRFEIADTGPGIAPEEVDTLFEAFVQSQTGKKSQEGTGLGLAISQQFVKLMGGTISVRSTLGQGSIFTFEIPITTLESSELQNLLIEGDPEGSRSPRVVLGLAPDQPRYRILVVEDVWASRHLLVKLLEQIGFEVREASNGEEAVSIWHSWQPHLIFMDIRMPVMDGYQATKAIRSSVNGEFPVIIALTASAFESERDTIVSIGCNDFIAKPFAENILFEKIAFYLGVHYIYEESRSSPADDRDSGSPKEITTEDVAVMPPDWIDRLHFFALSARSKNLQQLIEQIPPKHQILIQGLTDLVRDLHFDTIVALSEKNQP